MKTRLFKIAHQIKGSFANFSAALKYAWRVVKLQQRMKTENVSFVYRKVDGTIREAIGTLNVQYERKTDAAPKYDSVAYFDVEAGGFRSFKVENLIY